jgi:hypothetical protein
MAFLTRPSSRRCATPPKASSSKLAFDGPRSPFSFNSARGCGVSAPRYLGIGYSINSSSSDASASRWRTTLDSQYCIPIGPASFNTTISSLKVARSLQIFALALIVLGLIEIHCALQYSLVGRSAYSMLASGLLAVFLAGSSNVENSVSGLASAVVGGGAGCPLRGAFQRRVLSRHMP